MDGLSQNRVVHGANVKNAVKGYAEEKANALKDEILNSKNTEMQYAIRGKKYYFSEFGDDANTGLSSEFPLKSLNALEKLALNEGDAILFERGSIYRISRPIIAKSGITYGSYGKGDKPTFYASARNYADSEDLWQKTGKENIWRAEFNNEPAGGIIFDDGQFIGRVRHSGNALRNSNGSWYYDGKPELVKNGDTYHDYGGGTVYLYCDGGNPAKLYNSIEIMPRVNIIAFEKGIKNVVVDNLCLKYTGGFPISGADDQSDISVTNCEIGYNGGLSNGTVRFGNAFELWAGAKNVTFEHNWVYQTFDSAISWQGNRGNEYENISFCNNLFEYNNADIEFFERKGAVVKDFYMDNNIMRFTSMGWGTNAEDGGIRGIEGCVRAVTLRVDKISGVTFRDNIMDCPARQIINWNVTPEQKKEIIATGNKVYFKESCRTTNVALQGLQNSDEEGFDIQFKAENEEQLSESFNRFENDISIEWHK